MRRKKSDGRFTGPLECYRVLRRNFGFDPKLAGYVTINRFSRSIAEWRTRCERLDAYFEKTGTIRVQLISRRSGKAVALADLLPKVRAE